MSATLDRKWSGNFLFCVPLPRNTLSISIYKQEQTLFHISNCHLFKLQAKIWSTRTTIHEEIQCLNYRVCRGNHTMISFVLAPFSCQTDLLLNLASESNDETETSWMMTCLITERFTFHDRRMRRDARLITFWYDPVTANGEDNIRFKQEREKVEMLMIQYGKLLIGGENF